MAHEHIKIWGPKIPYNTGKSKYDDLVPFDEKMDLGEALAHFFVPELRQNNIYAVNNITRLQQIAMHRVSENYDDEAYIVPFIVKDSKDVVLLVPGGAYFDCSLDGEGYPSAKVLNELGISCFVLKYRVYPYKYPSMQLDCRRALCYIKAHANEYGYDADKVHLVGFSAGGNLVLTSTLLFKDMPSIEGYIEDEIDKIDPTPATLAPIYAEAMADRTLLGINFGQKVFDDEEYYQKLKIEQNMPSHINKDTPPLFIMDCIDDAVVDPLNTISLAKACHDVGIKYEVHMFTEGGHGFGMKREDIPPMYGLQGFNMSGTRMWPDLYKVFIKKVNKGADNK